MQASRTSRATAGFSMVELLIVAVLGSIIMLSAYQVLQVNTRTYTAQNAQIQGQATVRAATDVLFNEFRELSTGVGDIVGMSSDSLRVRVLRTFGLVCSTTNSQETLTVLQVGEWFEQYDTVYVMADNNELLASDDEWLTGVISTVPDTTETCGTKAAQQFNVPQVKLGTVSDTIKAGGVIRSYLTYTYGIFTIDGVKYLARRDTDGTLVPLVGPLSADATTKGLEFTYLKSNGSTTTVKDSVAQIEVTLRTLSSVRDAYGNLVADSVTMRIFSRN